MAKRETIRLADIVVDVSIQHRKLDAFTVGRYRQALRAGAKLPPLIVEKETNRLVCGHHRYTAYRGEYEPSTEVPCIYEQYGSLVELWERAVSDNIAHGRPLDPFDKKCILLKMLELGASKERIASLLSITVDKLEEWNGMMVVVTGTRDGQPFAEPRPVKHGLETVVPARLSEAEWESEVVRCATGVQAARHASALCRLLTKGWIDLDDEKTVTELRALQAALGGVLR